MNKQNQEGKAFVRKYNAFKERTGAFGGSIAILEDMELSCQAKILFHIIASYCFVIGYCSVSPKILKMKLGKEKTSFYTYLKELKDHGLIIHKTPITASGPRIRLYLDFDGMDERYIDR